MGLNDEFYSRLVDFYRDLNDEQIQKFNARLILLILNEVENVEKASSPRRPPPTTGKSQQRSAPAQRKAVWVSNSASDAGSMRTRQT